MAATTFRIAWTQIGIYPRAEPSMESAKVGSALMDGSLVSVECESLGTYVSNGSENLNIWDRLTDGTWLPNAFLDTGFSDFTPGVPRCDELPITAPNPPDPNRWYNRGAAARWALDHAKNSSIAPAWGAGCTWFVSQALWAGGFPEDSEWTRNGTHGRSQRPGSVTAWSVVDLLAYLPEHFDVHVSEPLDFRGNAVPEANVGDLIAYDWEGDGEFDHFTIITRIADGQYPEVSEWGTGRAWEPNQVNYQKRGWTYSRNNSQWLQVENPHVTAILIHFNGGYLLPEF